MSTTPGLVQALQEEALLQVQIEMIERCYWLISDRITIFDALCKLTAWKTALEHKMQIARDAVEQEVPTRTDRKVIT